MQPATPAERSDVPPASPVDADDLRRVEDAATPWASPTSHRSIARRLLFWLLVIALLPCVLLTALTSWVASNSLDHLVRDRLTRTAALKARELETYARERVRHGQALSREPSLVRAVRELAAPAGDGPVASEATARRAATARSMPEIADFLRHVADTWGYSHVLLFDVSGRVLYSLDDSIAEGSALRAALPPRTELAAALDRCLSSRRAELAPFQSLGAAGQQPLAFVASPILDGTKAVGSLALGFGPEGL